MTFNEYISFNKQIILIDNETKEVFDVNKNILKELSEKIGGLELEKVKQYLFHIKFKQKYRVLDIDELIDLKKYYEKKEEIGNNFTKILRKYLDDNIEVAIEKFILIIIDKKYKNFENKSKIIFSKLFDRYDELPNEYKVMQEIINYYEDITGGARYSIDEIDFLFDAILSYVSFIVGNGERKEFENIKKFLKENYPEIML